MHALLGLLYTVSARTLLGEVDLSPEAQRKLIEVKRNVDKVSQLVGNFSPTQPGSWVQFVGRYMEHTFDACRSFDTLRAWLRGHGYAPFRCDVLFLLEELLELPEVEMVFRDNYGELHEITLTNGIKVCVLRDTERARERMELYVRWTSDGGDRILDAVAEAFWRARSTVIIDVINDGMTFRDIDLSTHAYEGSLLGLIAQWKAFREAGIRRNVLLQGRPGTGKSTFCFHAARELSKRTLMLTADFCSEVRVTDWALILSVLRPEMVIVDDIDRVGGHGFEAKLRMFEEGYCDIPFVLFTSNDHTKLPQAMRRPGRIDQIIKVDEPDERVRRRIIGEMAVRVGVEIPNGEWVRLENMLAELSVAHVIEALRRAKVDGWSSEPVSGDVTFDSEESQRGRGGLRVV
ncbi:MAG: ATP-binding protein [Bradymonadaceae bacterium]|nr:ATP-binding protein [Lujinxingiaceae bacterium]